MNTYLMEVAAQLPRLRSLLNWTQDDLARRVGISRPTLIAMEKDPERLTRPVAIAIFAVVQAEIRERGQRVGQIDFRDAENAVAALTSIGLSAKVATAIFPAVLNAIGKVGKDAAERAAYGFIPRMFSKPGTPVDAERLRTYVDASLRYISAEVEMIFGLPELDVVEFIRRMDAGETCDDALGATEDKSSGAPA